MFSRATVRLGIGPHSSFLRICLLSGSVAKLPVTGSGIFVMAGLWNRADHYIFILWFLSIFYLLLLFSRLISAAAH